MTRRQFASALALFGLAACQTTSPIHCPVFLAQEDAKAKHRKVAWSITIPEVRQCFDRAHVTIKVSVGTDEQMLAPTSFEETVDRLPWSSSVSVERLTDMTRVLIGVDLDLDGTHHRGEIRRKLSKNCGMDRSWLLLSSLPDKTETSRPLPLIRQDEPLRMMAPQPSLGGLAGGWVKVTFQDPEASKDKDVDAFDDQVTIHVSDYVINALATSPDNEITTMRVWWTTDDPSYVACSDGSGYFLKENINKPLSELPHPPNGVYSRDVDPIYNKVTLNEAIRVHAVIEEKVNLQSIQWHFYSAPIVANSLNTRMYFLRRANGLECDDW